MGGKRKPGVNWKTILKIWKENAENIVDPFTAERLKSAYYPLYTHSQRPEAMSSYRQTVVQDNIKRNYTYMNETLPVCSGYASDGSKYNQRQKPLQGFSYTQNNNINYKSRNGSKQYQHRGQSFHVYNAKEPVQQLYERPSKSGLNITRTSTKTYEDGSQNSTVSNVSNASLHLKSASTSSATSASLSEIETENETINETDNENNEQLERERKYLEDRDNLSIHSDDLLFNSDSFQRISAAVNYLLPSEPPKPNIKKVISDQSSDSPPKYLDCSSRSVCGCNANTCSDVSFPTKKEIIEAKEKQKCKCGHKINENVKQELKFITDLVNVEKKIRAVAYRPDKTRIQKIYNTHLTNKYFKEKRKILEEFKQLKKERIKKRLKSDCEFSCCFNLPPGTKNNCSLRKCSKKCTDYLLEDDFSINAIDPFYEIDTDDNEGPTCKRGRAGITCRNKYPSKIICDPPCNVHKIRDVNGFINYVPTGKSCNDEKIKMEEAENEILKRLGISDESNIRLINFEGPQLSSSSNDDSSSDDDEC